MCQKQGAGHVCLIDRPPSVELPSGEASSPRSAPSHGLKTFRSPGVLVGFRRFKFGVGSKAGPRGRLTVNPPAQCGDALRITRRPRTRVRAVALAGLVSLGLWILGHGPSLSPLIAQAPDQDPPDPIDSLPSQDLRLGGDAHKRYFLIGPTADAKPPKDGFGLAVIMPGGDGSAEFHSFVKRIFLNGLPDGYVAVQPVSVKWTDSQEIVWPTETNKVTGMKFSTEAFVEELIAEVGKKQKINSKRVFTLSWSSSGPAAYAISLRKSRLVAGSFVAMSVFKENELGDLGRAKGHAYYLLHSPDDKTCPFRMAEQAKAALSKKGAAVELATYDGGHGWKGNVYGMIRTGMEWLEKQTAGRKGK